MTEGTDYLGEAEGNTFRSQISFELVRRWLRLCCLILADVSAFACAEGLFRTGRIVPELLLAPAAFPQSGKIDLFYVLACIFIVIRYIAGDYTRRQLFWDGARLTTIGLFFASAPCLLLLMFAGVGYSPFAVIGSWLFVIIAVPCFRHLVRWLLSCVSLWQVRTALIGDSPRIKEAYSAFRDSLSLGFDVKHVVYLGAKPERCDAISGVECIDLKDTANIVTRLSAAGCTQAVITTDSETLEETDNLIQRLLAAGIKIVVIPSVRRLPLLGMTTNYFFGREFLLLHVRNNLGRLPSKLFKRAVDVVGSAALLVVLSPIFIFLSYLVKREDGGPAFFVQPRVGRHGREFGCVKFRTMRQDAEEMLARWRRENSPEYQEYVASNFKLRNDPRITSIGRWLRRTSLDELPQLFNVLKGEMSLVGPRPLLAREVSSYGVSIDLYKLIRPGITGMWQISGRSATRFVDRVASDEWYIKNWSFWYDIVILLKTVAVLISRDGAF